MSNLPITTAYLKIHHQNFSEQYLDGEISAGSFQWEFKWMFSKGELCIEPSLGKALIEDALMRFLIKADYHLEPGGDYNFIVRSRF